MAHIYPRRLPIFTFMLLFCTAVCKGQIHQRTFKLSDTTGLASIEARLGDFELILKENTDKVATDSNLGRIKILTNVDVAVGDTLLNHIVPIFDGYNTLHPEQGQALKNICDLSDNILGTKSLQKAKKFNQQIQKEYVKLVQAK